VGPIMLDLRKHDGRNSNLRALAAMGYDLTIADGGYAVFTPPGLILDAGPPAMVGTDGSQLVTASDAAPDDFGLEASGD